MGVQVNQSIEQLVGGLKGLFSAHDLVRGKGGHLPIRSRVHIGEGSLQQIDNNNDLSAIIAISVRNIFCTQSGMWGRG